MLGSESVYNKFDTNKPSRKSLKTNYVEPSQQMAKLG
jgi:hypothetical protein